MRSTARLVLLAATPSLAADVVTAGSLAECDALVRAHPESYASYLCFYLVALRENAWDAARERLEALLSRDAQNHFARGYLAQLEADQRRDRAEGLFRVAADGLAGRGDRNAEAYARIGLAYFLMRRERLEEAETEAERARQAADARDDRLLVARVAVLQAAVANRREEYGRAWRLLKEVERDLFPDGPLDLRTYWLSSMGYSCRATGRHEEAMGSYRKEADLVHQSGNLYQEALVRVNMVSLAAALEMDRETTAALARDALSVAIAGGNRDVEARAHVYLAELAEGREALEHAERSLALSREMQNPVTILMALRAWGSSLLESHPDEAFGAIEEALAFARRFGDVSGIARTRVAGSQMRWRVGPRAAAIADSLAALDAIEKSRDIQPDRVMRARVFAQWDQPYASLVGRLLSGDLLPPLARPSPEDLELAFSIMERRRARSLLDELDAAQATAHVAAAVPLHDLRERLLSDIARVQRQLVDPALPENETKNLIAELERLEVDEEALREEMARADPAFASLRRPSFPSLREVREALGGDEALLAFQIARRLDSGERTQRRDSWLLVLTTHDVRTYPLPDSSELDLALHVLVGLFERRDGSEGPGAVRLYNDLLARALEDLGPRIRRLIVLPDEALHRLPFGALRRAAHVEPIMTRYEISLAPSATLWLRWQQSGTVPAEIPALALADPTAPGTQGEAAGPSAQRGWALEAPLRLGPLVHARAEGRDVVRLLGGQSRLLVGGEATERFLKTADFRRFGILHLAAHAVHDDERPDRSAVLVAPGDEREDGLLQIREIVGLDLRGRVVILSACRSASGTVWHGEGVMGLARAFFQAGAHTVVGSLWPLRDLDAAVLFEDFYRHLAQGKSVAGALAHAQRDRMRAGAPAAAWAGVVALGDGDLVPFPGGRSRTFLVGRWALVLGALLAAAALLFTVSRWRQ